MSRSEEGREAYEADVRKRPNYHDGSPRPRWDQLREVAKYSWESIDRTKAREALERSAKK